MKDDWRSAIQCEKLATDRCARYEWGASREVGGCFGSGCGRARHQTGHPNQVVGDRHQIASQLSLLQPNVASAAEATHRFHPAKDLFDPFADALAGGVADVTCSAAIDRAAPPTGVLRHVRRDLPLTQVSDTRPGVVAFVSSQR